MVQEKSFDDQPSGDDNILDLKAEAMNDGDPAPEAAGSMGTEEPVKAPTESGPVHNAAGSPAAVAGRSSPSSAGLVAAGILGGLVALLGAGSMQYAGYLPAATQDQAASAPAPDLTALRAEIDGLKQQLATIPADLQPNAEIEQRLKALEEKPAGSAASDPALASKLDMLNDRLTSLQQAAAQADQAAEKKVAELGNRLQTAEKTIEARPGETAVSRTIAATYLKAAVDRGDPFLTELDTFASLVPDDAAIADLRPLAAAGVRSKAALARDFDTVARTIMDALDQPSGNQSWTDRLMSSARSLVSIRPVGNVEGSDAGAVLARLEDKLKNGDLKGAALEWEALPAPARDASAEFKRELDNRVKADVLTEALVGRSKSSALQAG